MSDSLFEAFKEEFGDATSTRRVPDSSISKYSGRLPDRLLQIWRDEGWATYRDGLFSIVDPDEYEGVVEEWLDGTVLKDAAFRVIARTAFGKLYAWSELSHQDITIECAENYVIVFADTVFKRKPDPDVSVAAFFGSLQPHYADMEDDEGEGLFERALAQLGPLSKDELYGFEPALVLGGPCRIENLRKLRLDVHLSILRQFEAPRIPNISAPP